MTSKAESRGTRGAALRKKLTDEYDWQAHELELVEEVCRTLDVIDELAAIVRGGVTSTGSMGQPVVHPAVAELRQQQAGLAKLLTMLNIPPLDEGEGLESPRQARGRLGAAARWSRDRSTR